MPSSQHAGGHKRGSSVRTFTPPRRARPIFFLRAEPRQQETQPTNGQVCAPCKPIVACLACINDTDWMAKSRHRPGCVILWRTGKLAHCVTNGYCLVKAVITRVCFQHCNSSHVVYVRIGATEPLCLMGHEMIDARAWHRLTGQGRQGFLMVSPRTGSTLALPRHLEQTYESDGDGAANTARSASGLEVTMLHLH